VVDDTGGVPTPPTNDKGGFPTPLSDDISGFPSPLVDGTSRFTGIPLGMLDTMGVEIGAVEAVLPLDMGVFNVEKGSLSR
jgi:hypothetical protein